MLIMILVYCFFGAACLGNEEAMAELAGKFDLIIDTCPENSDIAAFMEMLKFDGTYCRVG
jgi:D-arabinose 1-dehydrogenase-like Zn-dependent alcohol dehydrogenase